MRKWPLTDRPSEPYRPPKLMSGLLTVDALRMDEMSDGVTPTDPKREEALGRIALWLDPADVQWIADNDICGLGPKGRHTPQCGRIRWKAESALHKAGLKN